MEQAPEEHPGNRNPMSDEHDSFALILANGSDNFSSQQHLEIEHVDLDNEADELLHKAFELWAGGGGQWPGDEWMMVKFGYSLNLIVNLMVIFFSFLIMFQATFFFQEAWQNYSGQILSGKPPVVFNVLIDWHWDFIDWALEWIQFFFGFPILIPF